MVRKIITHDEDWSIVVVQDLSIISLSQQKHQSDEPMRKPRREKKEKTSGRRK